MCGLFGIIKDTPFSEAGIARARAARDTLIHRGPDQAGEFTQGNIYIGHRRLSILDLSDAGRQPMTGNGVTITANGEIYNFRSLRAELESAGHKFKSNSDSEIILHGYRHWGIEKLAQKIDGMLAATVYDAKQNKLFALRDRSGIKPLFYFHDGRNLAWASELKALENALPAAQKIIDNTALYDVLTYRYIPAPKSLYKNIFKLLPGHMLTFDLASGRLETKSYWTLPVTMRAENHDALAEELRALVQAGVKSHLMSDVPLGYFLSGGMDSSIVLYHAAQLHAKNESFSIGFDDKSHDETKYAQLMSAAAGIKNNTRILKQSEIDDIFTRLKNWYDEPFSDTSAVPTFRVCEFAREKVTVALSGDGGDELFGGYTWYERFNRVRNLQKFSPLKTRNGLPLENRKLFQLTVSDPIALYAYMRSGLPAHSKTRYREQLEIPRDYDDLWHYRAHWRPGIGPRKSLQYLDFHTYLPNNIFTKIDRLSMAVSLESRVPFMAKEIMEFAFSLPEDFIYKNNQLKGGLKYAYKDALPAEILARGKKGFSMPVKTWKAASLGKFATFQEAVLNEFQKAA